MFPEEPLDTSLCVRAAIQPQSWADVFRGLVALDLPHRKKGRETGRKIVAAYKDLLPLDNAAIAQLVEASSHADASTLAVVWTPMLNTLGLESNANHLRSEMQRTGHPGLSELENVKAIRNLHEKVQARKRIEQASSVAERRNIWIEYTTNYGVEPVDFDVFYDELKDDPAYLSTAIPAMLRNRHREHLDHYVHSLAAKWITERPPYFTRALFSNAKMAMPFSYAPSPDQVGTANGMAATVELLSVEERKTLNVASYVLKGFQSSPESWHPCNDFGCVLPSKGPLIAAVSLNVHVLKAMGVLDDNDLNWTVEWWPGDITLAECLPKLRRVIPSEVHGIIEAGVSMGLEYHDMIVLACSAMERTWQHDAITSIEVPVPVLEEAGL